MRGIRRGKGLLAAALCAALAVSGLPAAAFAQEETPQGLCQHHPAHTSGCGYIQAEPCEHQTGEGGAGGDTPPPPSGKWRRDTL